MNWYVENIESQSGKGAMALYPTPGLALVYNLGSAPIRGLVTVQGRTFAVAGTVLFELLAPSASPNFINRNGPATLVADGLPVSMAGGGTQLLIASGGSTYVFDLNANTLTDVSAAVGGAVSQVGYSDGFFLVLFKNSSKIQSSASLDATTWPGTNFTGVSAFSDNALALFFDHREMWVFGPKAIQPYYDSGNFPFPFDTISGAYIESGLAAANSIAKVDNSLFWLGADERGQGVVRRANGYQPVRVSNHAVEFAMQGYGLISDAVAYAYQDQGHDFYVLGFPSADKTWVYDAATGMWHERGYWNAQAGQFNRHRAAFHTFNFAVHLVGDYTTGIVYQMAIPSLNGDQYQFVTDAGNPIRRVRRAPHLSTEQEWTFHAKLQVDVETGLGPVPGFQGFQLPTSITLNDANGLPWSITISDAGVIQVTQTRLHTPATYFLNDPSELTSWQLIIQPIDATHAILQAVAVASNPAYANGLPFVSSGGGVLWELQITNIGILQTVPSGIVTRGPLMMMRYSNDGGHSWSQEQSRDCGQAGQYTKRVIWWRLGRSRDRVYEIAVSDPIPWRVVDAYLEASPGFVPQERMIRQAQKQA
jgi:hypothetical protein